MVNSEHDIIRKIEAAKKNPEAAELLIETYMPFIKTQTAKVIKRIPQEENDDELSICLLYTSPSPRDGSLSRMPSSA